VVLVASCRSAHVGASQEGGSEPGCRVQSALPIPFEQPANESAADDHPVREAPRLDRMLRRADAHPDQQRTARQRPLGLDKASSVIGEGLPRACDSVGGNAVDETR